MKLSEQKCVPCEGGVTPITATEAESYLKELPEGWSIEKSRLVKEFKFKNFVESVKFINQVAEIAEEEGHHPDIHIFYNLVKIELWTHAINGLFINDFVLAAKIEKIQL